MNMKIWKKLYKLTGMKRVILLSLCIILTLAFPGASFRAYAATDGAEDGSSQEGLVVHFLDVGQGDAAVIQCDGKTMMIDGGPSKKSDYVYTWLKDHDIAYLDYMIATHPDSDHIGGLSGALQYAEVGTAYCSVTEHNTRTFDSLVKYLDQQGKELKVPSAGKEFDLGDARVKILGPVEKPGTGKNFDSNNSSLVLKVIYGNTSFLFTGDAEEEEEQSLLETYGTENDELGSDDDEDSLKSTVLKVGHHGSESSTSYRFLREVAPDYAVISVGKDNSYGHPTEEVLSRLRDADVKTWRTDMQGTITAESDGKNVTFQVEKQKDADTLKDAGKGHTTEAYTTESTGAETVQPSGGSSSAKSTYILNTNTMKFHSPGCRAIARMKEKNKQEVYASKEELIQQGYQPCGICQ